MKKATGIAILLSAFWLIIKIAFKEIGVDNQDSYNYGITLNILFIVLSAFFGVWFFYRQKSSERKSFLSIAKKGAVPTSIYALLTSLIIYVYYSKIQPDFYEDKKQELITKAREEAYTPELWKKIEASTPAGKSKTQEDFIAEIEKKAEETYAPSFQSRLSLMVLMITGIFYSMLIAVLFYKFLPQKLVKTKNPEIVDIR